MLKLSNFYKIGLLSCFCTLSACGLGGGGSISIGSQVLSATNASYTSNSCTNMQTGSTCTIQLNLNNNGQPNLVLTYSSIPDVFTINPQFDDDVQKCNDELNNSNNQQVQCILTIEYENSNSGQPNSQNANLIFSLANANNPVINSSPIILSGN